MFPYSLANAQLGSLDLFDLIIRIRTPHAPSHREYPVRQHEFFHYVQLVSTKVGLGHLFLRNQLFSEIEAYLAPEVGKGLSLPLVSYLGKTTPREFTGAFENIELALTEISDVWKFQAQYPEPNKPVSMEDINLTLDPHSGTINYANLATLDVGLQAICEQMSRAAEYTVRLMSAMQGQGLTDKASYLDDLKSGKINPNDFLPDVIPNTFPISGLLYDFPLFLSLQRMPGLPFNIVTYFALLAGWIVLMSSDWAPRWSPPKHLGRDYLEMLDKGMELAYEMHEVEKRKLLQGDMDGYNAIRMADRICKYFERRPFSEAISDVKKTLIQVADLCVMPNNKSQLYWCAKDGLEILDIFHRRPQSFFLPLSGYEKVAIKLPHPPIFYNDTVLPATAGNDRTLQHAIMAVFKEFLFASHDMSCFRTSAKNFSSPNDSCLFGDNCIFRPPFNSADGRQTTGLLSYIFHD